jgi:ADP-ribose pyrophosphatase
MQEWELVSSEVVYDGRFKVLRDRLKRPDGGDNEYTWTPLGDAVAVLAFEADGSVVLTRQYRHPMGRVIFDLPAGGVEASESYVEAAHRELREETGYIAGRLEPLGAIHPSPGRSPTAVHVFVAHDLTPGPAEPDESEFIEVVAMPWPEVLQMVLAGLPVDGTLAYAVLAWHAKQTQEAP